MNVQRLSGRSGLPSLDRRLLSSTCFAAGFFLLAQAAMAQMQGPPAQAQLKQQDFNDNSGFTQLFDGETLDGWEGEPGLWRVEGGAIVATRDTDGGGLRADFLIWTEGEVGDFEIKYEVKVEGSGNGGLQFRSRRGQPSISFGPGPGGPNPGGPNPGGAGPGGPNPGGPNDLTSLRSNPYNVQGYQADVDASGGYAGQLFEGGLFPGERGITTRPGQVVALRAGQSPVLLGSILPADADPAAVAGWKSGGWNRFRVIAQGRVFMIFVNDQLMSITIDEDPDKFVPRGILAIQLEGTMVAYRNIWLRNLDP